MEIGVRPGGAGVLAFESDDSSIDTAKLGGLSLARTLSQRATQICMFRTRQSGSHIRYIHVIYLDWNDC